MDTNQTLVAPRKLQLPTEEEKRIVQETFKLAEPNAAGIAEMFYNRLFEIDASLKPLFKGDMKTQGEHLMSMIKTAVEGLDNLDAIVPAVQDLGRRHVDYGVKEKDYGSVAEALLWTLGKSFGDAFTAEVKGAWTTVYMLLANVMMNAADASVIFQNTANEKETKVDTLTKTTETAGSAGGLDIQFFSQMADLLPSNLMVCDPKTLNITYVNATSRKTLRQIEGLLPAGVNADNIIGQCIDVFHKNPSFQRGLLSKTDIYPHKALIRIGDEILDLHIDAIKDSQGGITALMLAWNVVTESERLKGMFDLLPTNVMTCDPKTFNVTYANQNTIDTLNTLTGLLPAGVTGDNIVGQCIDIFHKNPAHQRRMLADLNNLPHTAIIRLGGDLLELFVDVWRDRSGNAHSLVLKWDIVTERERLKRMVDVMPMNVMMCDPKSLEITFVNQTSINTLKPLESLLPCKADDLLGQCIDIFHKNPSHQRQLLGNPKNLPHKANITLGTETLSLEVSAIIDDGGYYIGPMLAWNIVTAQVALANNVKEVVGIVASASTELQNTAQGLSATAEQTSQQSAAVAAAAEQASTNVQTVASAAEELSASIEEVGRQVKESSEIAQGAAKEADHTNVSVEELAIAAEKIGEVVNLISDIAAQTNLLALNATIEAARAGDAGKGFAVVANEVKSLASQTAKATGDISAQISSIQNATGNAVKAIKGIGGTINKINEIATAIASAVEEQGAATQEIARNVQEAASGTQEVTSNIAEVQKAAAETGESSSQVLNAAAELSKQAEALQTEIEAFMSSQ
ncbi:MAG: methyl-accepting chemotaxis protein [Proteobacteria bacterium]|nr:methyl-accepting chemotaxis protein [Pseudomonadota bacterium]